MPLLVLYACRALDSEVSSGLHGRTTCLWIWRLAYPGCYLTVCVAGMVTRALPSARRHISDEGEKTSCVKCTFHPEAVEEKSLAACLFVLVLRPMNDNAFCRIQEKQEL